MSRTTGLTPCPTEPTILVGRTVETGTGVILLVYVDDLIIGATKPEGILEIRKALEQHVKVKSAGNMTSSKGNGGKLHFLGKDIERAPKSRELKMRVPPAYLESLFTEYGDLKATTTPLDLYADLEKPSERIAVLSNEAASRYRRVLGRLAWWGHSRPDHGKSLSLLAQGQKEPANGFERAMRRYRRYVKGTCHLYNVFLLSMNLLKDSQVSLQFVTLLGDPASLKVEEVPQVEVFIGVVAW